MKRYYIKTKTIFYRGFTAPIKIGDDTVRIVKVRIDIRLVKFLRRHKAYSEFEREVRKHINNRPWSAKKSIDIERITEGLILSDTRIGFSYWSTLSELFLEEGAKDADLS